MLTSINAPSPIFGRSMEVHRICACQLSAITTDLSVVSEPAFPNHHGHDMDSPRATNATQISRVHRTNTELAGTRSQDQLRLLRLFGLSLEMCCFGVFVKHE
jgi:hypothetical protein